MKEKYLQKIIIDYLQLQENLGRLYFFRSGSGAVKTEEGRYFKSGKKGCQDITVLKKGQYIALEIKGDKGRQSNEQKKTQEKITNCGGFYYLIRDFEQIINIFK